MGEGTIVASACRVQQSHAHNAFSFEKGVLDMKRRKNVSIVYVALLAGLVMVVPTAAFATNGMNLEGYGPIATGMGGASMAYDNGSAAMMNNPATIGLMPEGSRFDVALGYLGPNVTASIPMMGINAGSTATSFYMPALGWVKRSGKASYGVGMFAQGGMGTQYEAETFMTAGSFQKVRSEVSVGRLLVPVSYDINPNLKIGGTLDFVWAGMDLKMALSGEQFGNMIPGMGGNLLSGIASGTMVNTLVGAFTVPQAFCGGVPCLSNMNWARFDFSNNNDYSGKAMGTGAAAKIGAVYTVNSDLNLGIAYHSKTALSDLTAENAVLSMNVVGPATMGADTSISVKGKIEVKDFEWPQMLGFGAAYKATDQLMLVADYKWINWKDVMKDFKMTFTADAVQLDPMAAGFQLGMQSVDATMHQNWKDQNVFMLGAAYAVNDMFTMRAGANIANNPIPNFYLNPLFPAIIKNHYTLGAGIAASKESSVDLSMTYAPEVSATNGEGVTVKHSQTNGQIMYSYRF